MIKSYLKSRKNNHQVQERDNRLFPEDVGVAMSISRELGGVE